MPKSRFPKVELRVRFDKEMTEEMTDELYFKFFDLLLGEDIAPEIEKPPSRVDWKAESLTGKSVGSG